MPHADILFKQLQMRDIDVISVKNYIQSFNNNIQKIGNATLKSEEPSTSAAKKEKLLLRILSDKLHLKFAILLYLKYITGLLSMTIS